MTIRGFKQGRLARLAAVVTASMLAVGATPSAWAATPVASARPATALEVASEPAGASVYVDGQLKGATPVAVEGIASGEHTVRLVKDGFLENSRTLAVPAGGRALSVRLTPTGLPAASRATAAASMLQVEPEEEKGGGGGKKWLWIGLGAVVLTGGIVGGYFLLKGTPAKVKSISASQTSGILQGATSVTFSASTEGDGLKYNWNFGDGQSSSDASPAHVFVAGGSLVVSLTVTDKDNKTASQAMSLDVQTLAGAWTGVLTGCGGCDWQGRFSLGQNGATISGSYTDNVSAKGKTGTVSGSVSSPRQIAMQSKLVGFLPLVWNGTLSEDGRTITGSVTGFTGGTYGFVMTR